MIDYSLGLRSSNPGEENSEKKVYAFAQAREVLTLKALARHISSHGSPFTRDITTGVLLKAVDCIREELLEGKKVQLGDLGAFYLTLSSEGAEDAEKFNPAVNITRVNVRWEQGEEFGNLISEATFNLVETRKEQREARKQLKAALNEVMGQTNSGDDNGGGSSQDGSGTGDPGDVTP